MCESTLMTHWQLLLCWCLNKTSFDYEIIYDVLRLLALNDWLQNSFLLAFWPFLFIRIEACITVTCPWTHIHFQSLQQPYHCGSLNKRWTGYWMHTRVGPLQLFQDLWKRFDAFAPYILLQWAENYDGRYYLYSMMFRDFSVSHLISLCIFLCVIGSSDVRAVCCYWQLQMSHMTHIVCTMYRCDLTFCHGLSLDTERTSPADAVFPFRGQAGQELLPILWQESTSKYNTHISACAIM